jgi:hypothetical protein
MEAREKQAQTEHGKTATLYFLTISRLYVGEKMPMYQNMVFKANQTLFQVKFDWSLINNSKLG